MFSLAPGLTILDVGCNRGYVSEEFAARGAAFVHGFDIDPADIDVARRALPPTQHRFEVVDLQGGPGALTAAFGSARYDIVLFLGVYHKLIKQMSEPEVQAIVSHLTDRAKRFFVFRTPRRYHPAVNAMIGDGWIEESVAASRSTGDLRILSRVGASAPTGGAP